MILLILYDRPNYIRSIQRQAEIHAIFEFTSSSSSRSYDFVKKIKDSFGGWQSYSRGWFRRRGWKYDKTETESTYQSKVDTDSMRSKLTIKIEAYGMALNEDGASTMVANNMGDLKKVLDFAFHSMQIVESGMVHGIEIVPWVDNPTFQVAAGLTDVLQECGEDEKRNDANTNDNQEDNKEDSGLLDRANPCRTLPMEVKKMALASNGEYVATMNRVMRAKIDQIHNIQHCRTILEMFPTSDEDKYLVNHVGLASSMTVGELKSKLDVEAIKEAQKESNNYIRFFYSPCMEALSTEYGGQIGATSMMKNWFSIPECQSVLCTVQGTTIDGPGECSIKDNENNLRPYLEHYCMPQISGN